jgi:hypothetical protein
MKSNVKPSLYFSAYPLKALMQDAPSKTNLSQSLYLKSIHSGKIRTMSRIRIFAMMNPYRPTIKLVVPNDSKLPKDIELTEKEWYNNYE